MISNFEKRIIYVSLHITIFGGQLLGLRILVVMDTACLKSPSDIVHLKSRSRWLWIKLKSWSTKLNNSSFELGISLLLFLTI